MSAARKLVAVVGATGKQGSSVINALVNEPGFALRALTRDPSKPAAQALAAKGVEVVKADMGSYEDLKKAFTGAHAVYAVTDFWASMSKQKEIEDGKRQAQAAADAGVQHFLWSSLDDVSKESGGRYTHVEHFDSKAQVERELPAILGNKWTAVYPAAYWENMSGMFAPRKADDGAYVVRFPVGKDTVYSAFEACEDTGVYVRAVLRGGDKFYGQRVLMCAQEITLGEMLEQWGKIQGVPTRYEQISADAFKANLPPALANEMYEMFAWWQDYGYFGGKDVKASQELVKGEKLSSWAEFVKKTKWQM